MTDHNATHPNVSEPLKARDHELQEWIEVLRAQGIKAAHPDDGHFDLHSKEVHFAYTHYNDGVKVGDQVVLGSPGATQMLVRLTGVRNNPFSPWDSTYWKFEIVEEDFKPAA